MSFSSVLNLFTNVTVLRREFGEVIGNVFGLKLIHALYRKLRNLFRSIMAAVTGTPATTDMDYIFDKGGTNQAPKKGGSWMNMVLLFFSGLWLLGKLMSLLNIQTSDTPPLKKTIDDSESWSSQIRSQSPP